MRNPGFEILNFALSWIDEAPDLTEIYFNLNPVVGRGDVCGFWGAGQGATTRNGYSISRRCNAAMRHKNRAIRPVADSPKRWASNDTKNLYESWN